MSHTLGLANERKENVPKCDVAFSSLFMFPKSESSCEIWFNPVPNLPDISIFWAFTDIGFQTLKLSQSERLK